MFSAKYKLLIYASPLNGKYSYWLALLRMLTMNACREPNSRVGEVP